MGAGGIAAAITAHDAGASVVVMEKAPPERAGGNSRVSGQVWFCPHDIERAKVHLRALGQGYPVPEDVVQTWATETARSTEWVLARVEETMSLVELLPGDPCAAEAGKHGVVHYGPLMTPIWPETHDFEWHEVEGNDCGVEWHYLGAVGGWSRLWLTLKASLDLRGIPAHYETRAVRLLQEDGAVVGVEGEQPDGTTVDLYAKRGVILASGGFANNQEMVRNYLRLTYATPMGSPENTGDGIRMAQKVGADLSHPYNCMAIPGIAMPPYQAGASAIPRDGRYIYVTADGRRFINEFAPPVHGKERMRGMLDAYPGFPMWTVFDEDGRLAGPLVAGRDSGVTAGWIDVIEGYQWSPDNSAEIERGWITKADTIRDLAAALEIDPDGLEKEVAEYNRAVTRGEDERFGRASGSMSAVARAPFYGFRWGQNLYTTLGGIRKDGHARALDPEGAPIPGLYCAGDTASTYTWLVSGGMGLSDAMAFGRLAARHAVERLGALADAHAE